jgi:hypothetical protein
MISTSLMLSEDVMADSLAAAIERLAELGTPAIVPARSLHELYRRGGRYRDIAARAHIS